MKRFRLFLASLGVVAALLLLPISTSSYFPPVKSLDIPWENATIRSICTVTAIDTKPVVLWLTAGHCVNWMDPTQTYSIGGYPAFVVDGDTQKDLALFIVPGLKAKGLKFGKEPKQTDELHFYGHPLGLGDVQFSKGYVSSIQTLMKTSWGPRFYMMFDMELCGGDSGSAVLDKHDKLVSVVQIGVGGDNDPCSGFTGGATYLNLKTFLAPYLK